MLPFFCFPLSSCIFVVVYVGVDDDESNHDDDDDDDDDDDGMTKTVILLLLFFFLECQLCEVSKSLLSNPHCGAH